MHPRTVLVVDPHPGSRRRVREALQRTGWTVIHAEGPARLDEAIGGASVDVAFVALGQGRGSGYHVARVLRDRFPAALILLMAGGFDVFDPRRAAASGADGHLSKPLSVAAVRERLEEALGSLPDAGPPASRSPAEAVTQPPAPHGDGAPQPRPPAGDERLATFLPRDPAAPEPVTVDPAVVGPALERAILEVLPEVVEGVLRSSLAASTEFRELVREAVREAVAEHLPELARERGRRDRSADGG